MTDITADEKLWEKCARMLMLNSMLKLESFLQTVVQITDNISSNPTTLKYRTLKYSNASINSKVLEVHGGVEFFVGIGFKNVTDVESGKVLRLDCPVGGERALVDNLNTGVSWLRNTLSTCQLCASSTRIVSSGDTCAECTIVIRLPTGASVSGGFMRGDKLDHVRSFACCHFVDERTRNVRLVLPESRVEVSDALLVCTLEEMGLFPRAVVFATVHSEVQREELLSQKHQELLHVQGSGTAVVKKEKKSKADERLVLKEERARILGAFKDDRHS